MTKREGAVLTAYTGILLCEDMDSVYEYYAELMGRPVYTHEIPELQEELKNRAEPEFKQIIESQHNNK